ncbi:PTPLA-domain-containing protein [Daedalea quercina L-15889]|uniref:Very-long-chain (3R)-3-hydroxyacyl-CoA dehydratase n=1 Tax=Daedalea quercina L-15889 TaxID=1314783 RepID=A0A165N1Y4_9APHY|nr:PTPLA-domain-containing protein [Daedalea quercina L-15889]
MSQAKEKNQSSQKPVKRGPAPLVKYYLVAYNVISTLGWGYVLVVTLAHLAGFDATSTPESTYLPAAFTRYLPIIPRLSSARHRLEKSVPPALIPLVRRASTTYAAVGSQTSFVQSFAVLEVLHALLGWVRSPLGTTAAQVASRLYLVWGITAQFEETRTHPLYALMVLSWSITEVVRYSFYAYSLLGVESKLLVWLRYTLFYVLYPTGAGSEAGLIYASLPSPPPTIPLLSWPFSTPRWVETLHDDFRCFMFLLWWPSLYVLYTYMMRQRRKVLGTGRARTLGQKPKTL